MRKRYHRICVQTTHLKLQFWSECRFNMRMKNKLELQWIREDPGIKEFEVLLSQGVVITTTGTSIKDFTLKNILQWTVNYKK